MTASQVKTCLLEVDAIVTEQTRIIQQLRAQLLTKDTTIRLYEKKLIVLQLELADALKALEQERQEHGA